MSVQSNQKQEPGFTPGPYQTETVEAWREIMIFSPWSDKVTAETATFADHRGAVIAKINYTENGVPTREQAEANARLLKAAPALYEIVAALGDRCTNMYAGQRCPLGFKDSKMWCLPCRARAALSLVDAPQTKETQ